MRALYDFVIPKVEAGSEAVNEIQIVMDCVSPVQTLAYLQPVSQSEFHQCLHHMLDPLVKLSA